jgi:hypothetical protein
MPVSDTELKAPAPNIAKPQISLARIEDDSAISKARCTVDNGTSTYGRNTTRYTFRRNVEEKIIKSPIRRFLHRLKRAFRR